jgi:signal transduction histidine kinase
MEPLSYPISDIALVIKRYSHDVRNALNGMEIELTSLGEAATDPAVLESVKRLREAGAEVGRLIQGLSSKYSTETAAILPVIQIAERWSADARYLAPHNILEWNIVAGSQVVWGEAGLIRSLLKDMLELAVAINGKRSLRIDCRCEEGRAVFTITAREGNKVVRNLDFHQAYWTVLRRLAERNQGIMDPAYLGSSDSSSLRLSFPLHAVA